MVPQKPLGGHYSSRTSASCISSHRSDSGKSFSRDFLTLGPNSLSENREIPHVCAKTHAYGAFHSSIVYTSKRPEITHESINKETVKQMAVHPNHAMPQAMKEHEAGLERTVLYNSVVDCETMCLTCPPLHCTRWC